MLRHITGNTQKFFPVTRRVCRETGALIDQINDFGNFRNHLRGDELSFGIAAVMCHAAVELINALARDYTGPKEA